MLRFWLRTLVCACAVVSVVLTLPARAPAAPYMVSIMQDDDELIYKTSKARRQALDRMKSLGVEAVRVTLQWEVIAPGRYSHSKPRGFNGAKPGDYSQRAWDRYDEIVHLAAVRGIAVNFNPTGPGPRWAHKRTRIKLAAHAWKPNPKQYGKFVRAAGRRYSGHYHDENFGKGVLPRVSWWGVWNEPNQPGWLTPQSETRPGGGGDIAAAPHIYRDLLVAGAKGLLRTGHEDDLVTIGELAPIGSAPRPLGARASLRPALFIRELFCMNRRFRAYTGREARVRDCGDVDRLRVLMRFPRLGFAHHPYTRKDPPMGHKPKRDMINVTNIGLLTRTLDRIATKTGLLPPQMPIFFDEFGYQTKPPDPYGGVSLALQARYINESDYIAWRNPRVFGVAQFLLYDSPPKRDFPRGSAPYWSTFQTGLFTELPQGAEKPAVRAYKFPLIVRRKGGKAHIWGQVRFAPNGATYPVVLQSRARGSGQWVRSGDPVQVTHSQGYFRATRPTRRGTMWRAVWAEPDFARVEISREAVAR
jgi:hypothetical protein